MSVIFTLILVIAYTNAINFSDGIGGLCVIYVLSCLISIIVFSYFSNKEGNFIFIIFLILSLFIFLFSNFNIFVTKSFLGESGSTFLGFICSYLLIFYTLPDNRFFHPVLALWASSIPTYDFITVFIKRLHKKKNPMTPDLSHIHFLMIKKNLSKLSTLIILGFSSLLFSCIGLITLKLMRIKYLLDLFLKTQMKKVRVDAGSPLVYNYNY